MSELLNELVQIGKLPKEFKTKWIAALSSGEYKKGKYKLYDPVKDNYCCLGVACILGGVTKGQLGVQGAITGELETIVNVPSIIMGHIGHGNVVDKLTRLNDSHESFAPVIEYIAENL